MLKLLTYYAKILGSTPALQTHMYMFTCTHTHAYIHMHMVITTILDARDATNEQKKAPCPSGTRIPGSDRECTARIIVQNIILDSMLYILRIIILHNQYRECIPRCSIHMCIYIYGKQEKESYGKCY